ncbi:hypothetical protein V865_005722 [Kwoniella europaea PYCC6329]|uniref:Uncharacterized protein n=1 Tax=Kwoniella europaea PYCC6329 TaxID=1423913 RepID=A0AAX4KMG1_9TREE
MDWADLINRQDYVDIPIAQDKIDMWMEIIDWYDSFYHSRPNQSITNFRWAILHSRAYTVDLSVNKVHIKEEEEDSTIPSMSQLNEQLRALTDCMNQSEALLEASIMAKFNAQLNALTDRVDKLELSLDDTTDHVKQFDDRFSHLEARIDNIIIERVSFEQDALVVTTTSPISIDDGSANQLDHPTSPITDEANHQAQEDTIIRVDRLSDKLVLVTSQIDRLDNKADRLDGKVDRYDTKVDKLEIKIDKHQVTIKNHDDKLQNAIEMIDNLDDTVDDLGNKLEGHTRRTDEIGQGLKKLMDRMCDRIKKEEEIEASERSTKIDHEGLEKEFNNFVEQVSVREMNRVLLEIQSWAHPVPDLKGDYNPTRTPNSGKWNLFLPSAIKEMSMGDLDKWLTFYGIGKDCKDFGFLKDVNKQGKQALLYNFIEGSNKPSDFKG